MLNLTHQVDRTIVIRARPETVFGFFEDNERWASWWGAGSTIDLKPGGRVYILHPGRIEIEGEVLQALEPDERETLLRLLSRALRGAEPLDPETAGAENTAGAETAAGADYSPTVASIST